MTHRVATSRVMTRGTGVPPVRRAACPNARAGLVSPAARVIRSFAGDCAGQMTIEWALVLAAFALPMYLVTMMFLNVLVAHFQMVSFMDTLPFP